MGYSQIMLRNHFYSLDPYYHFKLSQDSINTGNIKNIISSCISENQGEYPSLLRVITPVLSLVSGLNLLEIYRFFGLFCIAILLTSIFVLLRKDYGTKAVYFIPLSFGMGYLIWRSLITYPENLSLIFLIWILIYGVRIGSPYLLIIFSSALIFTHPPTFFIAPLILISLGLFKRYKFSALKKNLLILLATAILIIPLYPTIIYKVSNYINLHSVFSSLFGNSQDISNYEFDLSRYKSLEFRDYTNFIGLPLIIFGLLGFVLSIKNKDKTNLSIGLLLLFFLFLSTGFFGIFYFPFYRTISYISIFLVLTGSFYLVKIKGIIRSKKLIILLIFVILLSGLILAINLKGSNNVSEEEIGLLSTLRFINGTILSESIIVQSFGDHNVECDPRSTKKILTSIDEEDLTNNLKDYNPPYYLYVRNVDLDGLEQIITSKLNIINQTKDSTLYVINLKNE